MYARVTAMQTPPDQVDTGIRHDREHVLPAARELDGFAGLVFLVDRATGRSLTLSFWESEAALRRSEPSGDELRTSSAQLTASKILRIDRYEVTAAHFPSAPEV